MNPRNIEPRYVVLALVAGAALVLLLFKITSSRAPDEVDPQADVLIPRSSKPSSLSAIPEQRLHTGYGETEADLKPPKGGVDAKIWKRIRNSMHLVGLNPASGRLANDVVEMLAITAQERQRIDNVILDALVSVKEMEKENAEVVSEGSGDSVVIPPSDGSQIKSKLDEAIAAVLPDQRSAILSEVLDENVMINGYGKYPITIYFEQNARGKFRFNMIHTVRSKVSDETIERARLAGPMTIKIPPTMTIRKELPLGGSGHDRYKHILDRL